MAGRNIGASSILLIGPMPVLRVLADNYNSSSYLDASAAIIAITWNELISHDFHMYVPDQFQANLRRFHLWDIIFKDPKLVAFFSRLDSVSMGFLLQLEILCTDLPRACQKPGSKKCSGCRYKTRTLGVSANGKISVADYAGAKRQSLTFNDTLIYTATRELYEEMNLYVGNAAISETQARYRVALVRLLIDRQPDKIDIKAPNLFYDYSKTRLHILFVSQTDICPMFPCPQPDPWLYQSVWDKYVSDTTRISFRVSRGLVTCIKCIRN